MLRQSGNIYHKGHDGGVSHGEMRPTELDSGVMKNNFVARRKTNATEKHSNQIKASNWENKHLTRKKHDLKGRFVN